MKVIKFDNEEIFHLLIAVEVRKRECEQFIKFALQNENAKSLNYWSKEKQAQEALYQRLNGANEYVYCDVYTGGENA